MYQRGKCTKEQRGTREEGYKRKGAEIKMVPGCILDNQNTRELCCLFAIRFLWHTPRLSSPTSREHHPDSAECNPAI